MDHYFLLLEEETKNRHSQQLKVLQSQASACNIGIINTKQKSCPRCGLSANSHESLGIPPAGAPGGIQAGSLSAGGAELSVPVEKEKLRSKDTAAAASPAQPRLA